MERESGTEARARRRAGLIALGLVQLVFGCFPVFVKLSIDAGEGFSPRAIIVWRVLGGALLLGALARYRHPREFWPRRTDLGRLFACSVLGILANQMLAVEGTARTHAAHAGVLFTLIPVFTYAVAVIARQERMSVRRALGISVALSGAVWLILGRSSGAEVTGASAPVTGGLMIAANCLCYAIYLVIARPLLQRIPTLVVIAWAFLLSTIWIPFVGYGVDLWPATVSATSAASLAFLVVVITSLGYLLNTFALARVSASTTAVFIYIQPLVALLGATLLLREKVGLRVLGACALLLTGMGLVIWRRRT